MSEETEPITIEKAFALAATLNAKATPEERELGIYVVVRSKETGNLGLMMLWNEEEVDSRQELLDKNLDGAAEWYKEVVEETREFARVRRMAWKQEKHNYEILLPSRR